MRQSREQALIELDLEYARFNAQKALGDARESQFETLRSGSLRVIFDPTRTSPYYHRIVGWTPDSIDSLDHAIAVWEHAARSFGRAQGRERFRLRVDVDARFNREARGVLSKRGFRPTETIAWLEAPEPMPPPDPSAADPTADPTAAEVRQLRPDERDLLLPFLELEEPVDESRWAERSRYQCSESFPAYIVEADGRPAAMSTIYFGTSAAVLGNAVTLPQFRGRGMQTALLQVRTREARKRGVQLIVTDVAPESTSHRNCLRVGFREVLTQDIWER